MHTCRALLLVALLGCSESSTTQPTGSEDVQASVDTQSATDISAPADGTPADSDAAAEPDATAQKTTPPNILLIISDDLGIGASRCYNVGKDLAPMPNIEALCDRGMVFESMWSAPVCTPTRAALLTGRYAHRTGIGNLIEGGEDGLSTDEWSIPKVLDANPELGYQHACIGKWHLGPPKDKEHPSKLGFKNFSGLLVGGVQSYTSWKETRNGKTQTVTEYAPTRHINQALDFIKAQNNPWFLWMAMVLPHSPLHLPPKDLHSYSQLTGTDEDIDANKGTYFRAMIEAMDSEIGRLIDGIGEEQMANTIVIYVGDNGTSANVIEAPYGNKQVKGTLYQGGIHVPFVMAGPGIKAGRSKALTHVVDLFSTILDYAGVSKDTPPQDVAIDGMSLVPILEGNQASVHPWIVAELFGATTPNKAGTAVRNQRYKLTRLLSGKERFNDLETDPYESKDLTGSQQQGEALKAYNELSAIIDTIEAQ